jgi:hypothetical protein
MAVEARPFPQRFVPKQRCAPISAGPQNKSRPRGTGSVFSGASGKLPRNRSGAYFAFGPLAQSYTHCLMGNEKGRLIAGPFI